MVGAQGLEPWTRCKLGFIQHQQKQLVTSTLQTEMVSERSLHGAAHRLVLFISINLSAWETRSRNIRSQVLLIV